MLVYDDKSIIDSVYDTYENTTNSQPASRQTDIQQNELNLWERKIKVYNNETNATAYRLTQEHAGQHKG